MKRSLAIIATALCILLCSCSESNSVGIIGGSDGPTALIVSTDFALLPVLAVIVGIIIIVGITVVLCLINKRK
ncbi:MAG: hypothetical protein IJ391_06320 [Clostridia bacterium]|nr:hypothetical protein [Clostridia bacterium]